MKSKIKKSTFICAILLVFLLLAAFLFASCTTEKDVYFFEFKQDISKNNVRFENGFHLEYAKYDQTGAGLEKLEAWAIKNGSDVNVQQKSYNYENTILDIQETTTYIDSVVYVNSKKSGKFSRSEKNSEFALFRELLDTLGIEFFKLMTPPDADAAEFFTGDIKKVEDGNKRTYILKNYSSSSYEGDYNPVINLEVIIEGNFVKHIHFYAEHRGVAPRYRYEFTIEPFNEAIEAPADKEVYLQNQKS